nr:hypothetical protein HK105_006623 [Polyrhizophydium stewartii]
MTIASLAREFRAELNRHNKETLRELNRQVDQLAEAPLDRNLPPYEDNLDLPTDESAMHSASPPRKRAPYTDAEIEQLASAQDRRLAEDRALEASKRESAMHSTSLAEDRALEASKRESAMHSTSSRRKRAPYTDAEIEQPAPITDATRSRFSTGSSSFDVDDFSSPMMLGNTRDVENADALAQTSGILQVQQEFRDMRTQLNRELADYRQYAEQALPASSLPGVSMSLDQHSSLQAAMSPRRDNLAAPGGPSGGKIPLDRFGHEPHPQPPPQPHPHPHQQPHPLPHQLTADSLLSDIEPTPADLTARGREDLAEMTLSFTTPHLASTAADAPTAAQPLGSRNPAYSGRPQGPAATLFTTEADARRALDQALGTLSQALSQPRQQSTQDTDALFARVDIPTDDESYMRSPMRPETATPRTA